MCTKITDLIKNTNFTYSFEVTPNVSLELIDNLPVEPAFYSVTWHAKSHECKDLDIGPIKLASELKNRRKEVLLHISCDLLTKEYLNKLLQALEEKGICNIFLMLGEDFDSSRSEFENSKALIEYIRLRTGQFFCIGIAGFPDSKRRQQNLKDKIDSGADFIITQAFFEFHTFENFIKQCRDIGIRVPIIPGIFVYDTLKELIAFSKVCKVKTSKNLLENLNTQEFSVSENVKKLVINIINANVGSNHCHFFTLNKLDRASQFIMSVKESPKQVV